MLSIVLLESRVIYFVLLVVAVFMYIDSSLVIQEVERISKGGGGCTKNHHTLFVQ